MKTYSVRYFKPENDFRFFHHYSTNSKLGAIAIADILKRDHPSYEVYVADNTVKANIGFGHCIYTPV